VKRETFCCSHALVSQANSFSSLLTKPSTHDFVELPLGVRIDDASPREIISDDAEEEDLDNRISNCPQKRQEWQVGCHPLSGGRTRRRGQERKLRPGVPSVNR
jgi:hypothetical protein